MVLAGGGVFLGFGMGVVRAQDTPKIVYDSIPVVVHDPVGCHDMLPNALASCSPYVCTANVFAVRYKCLVNKNDKTCDEIKRTLFQRNISTIVGPQSGGRCYFTSRMDNDALNKHEVVADCRLQPADWAPWASALSEWQEGQLKAVQKGADKLDTYHLTARDIESLYLLPCLGQVLGARLLQRLTGSADMTLLSGSHGVDVASAMPIILEVGLSCQGSAVNAGLVGMLSPGNSLPSLPLAGDGQTPSTPSETGGSGSSGTGSCALLSEKLAACESYSCQHSSTTGGMATETVTGPKAGGACGFTSNPSGGNALLCTLGAASKSALSSAASTLAAGQAAPFEAALQHAVQHGECLEL